jgi:nucleotide-binding universal stress UspA family protein
VFTRIYVALDNSDHSTACVGVAVELAAAFGASCVGSHVYAARMHDYRFKQMEYTLPAEYQDEAELLRQRRIHDSLITTGLQLISDSYTDVMRYRCLQRGVPFEARAIDGRNWEELVRDVNDPATGCDLLVMGALGMGAVKESTLGSVVDRVMRRVRTDTLVVRHTGADTLAGGGILVAIDGSPQSFGGLRTALALGGALGRPVEAAAVYDPYLHYAVFNSIVDVLSEKASKVFRFKEQEALHEEIIDTGLARIYESHLQVARAMAAEAGVDLGITLLDGKPFEQLLRFVRERRPWLLVAGRIGVHSDAGMDIGSTTEQLVRLAPCNMLLSSRTHLPPIDTRAAHSVVWTDEAEVRMERVPAGARGIARTAVLRWCTERGHTVVSSGDVDAAIDELMPFQRTLRRLGEVAASLEAAERAMVEEPPAVEARAVCVTCGYAARARQPVVCPVCGGPAEGFERLDVEALLAAAADQGDAAETGFDGHKLGWTLEARTLLHQLPAGYLRRRVKAIVEKAARTRRLPAITVEIVEPHVRPELESLDAAAGPHRAPLTTPVPGGGEGGPRRLPWTVEAESRLERIPDGFLRNLAREQVERLALQVEASEVGTIHVEAGIAEARARMRSALGQEAAVPGGGCPVGGGATAPAEAEASPAAPGGCPMSGRAAAPPAEPEARVRLGGLNEVTAGFVESLGKKLGYGEVEAAGSAMPWTEAARERLARVPDTVRGEVMQAVEGNARAAGATQVDIDALDAMAGPSGERGDCHQGPSGFGAPDSGRP